MGFVERNLAWHCKASFYLSESFAHTSLECALWSLLHTGGRIHLFMKRSCLVLTPILARPDLFFSKTWLALPVAGACMPDMVPQVSTWQKQLIPISPSSCRCTVDRSREQNLDCHVQ